MRNIATVEDKNAQAFWEVLRIRIMYPQNCNINYSTIAWLPLALPQKFIHK